MQRREFITLLSGAVLASPRAAIGQTSTKVYRLGTLTPGLPRDEKSPEGTTLLRILAERGYALGKNLALDARGAKGKSLRTSPHARGDEIRQHRRHRDGRLQGRAICQGHRHSRCHRLRQRRSGCDRSGGQPGSPRRHRHRHFRRRCNDLYKAAVVTQAIAAGHTPRRHAVEPG